MRRRNSYFVSYLIRVICLLFVLILPAAVTAEETAGFPSSQYPTALFLNVGKADSALFFVDEQVFLVDTGTKGSAELTIKALETYGVKHLDAILITHTDKDHVGGLKKLLKEDITVDQLCAPKLHSHSDIQDHPVWKAANKHGMQVKWLEAGDVMMVGEDCSFTVLGPLSRDEENENNNSLVLHLQTPHGNMLLAGDMEDEEEAELLDAGLIPKADVLKVGHHGRNDASGKPFIYTVRPQLAIISTNIEDEPRSAFSKVIQRLWQVNATVLITQEASCGIWVSLQGGKATAARMDWVEPIQ